jgi:hypothetical protein
LNLIMEQIQLLRLIIREKALIKLLKTIDNKEYHTRELLKRLGTYGYGHKLLVKAHKIKLVERRVVKNKIYNRLTIKGKQLVKLAREIGI